MNDWAGIAPAILSLHPELDAGQRELIGHLEGPTLDIAGPGSGKTLAVALRGVNILLLGRARPEELVLCTYSRAAARELRQRFIKLATAAGCPGDLSRVRIGTIHRLCRRILRFHARPAGLGPDFQMLNGDEQWRLLVRHYDHVFGPDLDVLKGEGWRWREPGLVMHNARKHFERICDGIIAPGELTGSANPFHAALGHCYVRYRDLLLAEGSADFDHLQRWVAELLADDRIGGPLSNGIRHLICDEYQDTSAVQERLLLMLSRSHGNLCVVGDDDQSIYRFRGATVRNLLEFPERTFDGHTVALSVNYRSHPDIVQFYTTWMATVADWSNPDGGGRPFRHPKAIVSNDPGAYPTYPAVIAVDGGGDEQAEGRQLAELVRFLKDESVIACYDQVALLLHSVKGPAAVGYLDAFERAGVPVNRVSSGFKGRRPAGAGPAVTVTTIHQAKGREWDVVITGSLDFDNADVDPVGRELERYCKRPAFEPAERIADFDHARQHYVAFSRPRSLLVLTARGSVHSRFADAWEGLPRWDRMDRRGLARQRFRPPEATEDAAQVPEATRDVPYLRQLDVWLGPAAAANGQAPPGRKNRRP